MQLFDLVVAILLNNSCPALRQELARLEDTNLNRIDIDQVFKHLPAARRMKAVGIYVRTPHKVCMYVIVKKRGGCTVANSPSDTTTSVSR